MIVLFIIGVLATITIPNFGPARERAMDREAAANLRQMSAAERFFQLKNDVLYPSTGCNPTQHIQNINDNLKLDLISGNDRNWDYFCYNNGCVEAIRFGNNWRNLCLRIDDLDGEPNSGNLCITCPQ